VSIVIAVIVIATAFVLVVEPALIPGYPTVDIQNIFMLVVNNSASPYCFTPPTGDNICLPPFYPPDWPGLFGNVTVLVTGSGTLNLQSLLLNATRPENQPSSVNIEIASITLPNGTAVTYPLSSLNVTLPVRLVITVSNVYLSVREAQTEKSVIVSIGGTWSIGLSIPVHMQSEAAINWQVKYVQLNPNS